MRSFKKLHSAPKLSLLLSRAAKAYSSDNYKKAIESLYRESPTAYTWAMDKLIEHWCRHTFETTIKVVDNSINIFEPFNNVLDECRDLPVFNVCDKIIQILTDWFAKRKVEPEGWTGRIVSSIKEKLSKFEGEA